MKTEVLIIGAGFAGLNTAFQLAKRGYKVTVAYKGFGATAMSSGCFDILGYSYEQNDYALDPIEAFQHLPEKHPYMIITGGNKEEFKKQLKQAVNSLPEVFRDFLHGSYQQNTNHITLAGTIKTTAFVQKTMKGSEVKDGETYVILGLEGIYDFHPKLVETMLKTSLRAYGYTETKIKTVNLKKKDLTEGISASTYLPLTLSIEKFKKLLKKIVRKYSGLKLIPPIIRNFKNAEDLVESFEEEVSEVPATPIYSPGLRLVVKMVNLSKNVGASIIHVENVKVNSKTSEVTLEKKNKLIKLKPEITVIATGDLIGGGLEIKGNAVIDVVTERKINENFGEKIPKDYFNKNDELTRIGVNVNGKLQLTTEDIEANIFYIGSIIANYDYNLEKSGLGVPLLTSWKLVSIIEGE